MRSESRRYAQLLTSARERAFDGRHPIDESKARLSSALSTDKVSYSGKDVLIRARAARYEGAWVDGPRGARLEGRFVPRPAIRTQLTALSVLLALMLLGSAVSLMQDGGAARYAMPGVTAIVVLFFMPLYIMALGAGREGDEARIERAIRVALEDLDPKMPPPQRWKDEE